MLSFGINLRTLRVQKNLSQQDIADRLSINRTTYTKWELGVSEPSLTMLLKLAEIYDVDCNRLLEKTRVRIKHSVSRRCFIMDKHDILIVSKSDDNSIYVTTKGDIFEIAAAIKAITGGIVHHTMENRGKSDAIATASLFAEAAMKGACKGLLDRDVSTKELNKFFSSYSNDN